MIDALARRLWQQATGNRHDWNPLRSDRYNAASRRLAAITTRLRQAGSGDPAALDPRQADRDMAAARADLALMRDESRRKRARDQWIMGLLLVLALLATIASVVLRLVAR